MVPGDRFSFHRGNRVLSISPTHRTDTGEILCNVSNDISFQTAMCSLKVYCKYGERHYNIYILKIRTFEAHANPCSFDPVQTVLTNRSSLRNQKEQNLRNGSNSSALLNHCQRQLCFGHSKASRFPDPRSTSPSWRKNTSGFIPAPFVIL